MSPVRQNTDAKIKVILFSKNWARTIVSRFKNIVDGSWHQSHASSSALLSEGIGAIQLAGSASIVCRTNC